MIEAVRISKRIGERLVLADLSFRAEPGRLTAIFGPNGAGKSTLLRILALLVSPTFGQVLIDGRPVTADEPALRGRIGLLSHQSFLYEGLSALENLDFYARLYGVADADRRIRSLLDAVGLTLFAADPVRTYSRGMLQRLAIARTILHDPEILLLDEPYTGLDQSARSLLDSLIRDSKARGRTILLVSHEAGEGLKAADQVLVLARGRLAAAGPAAEWSAARLAEIYARPASRRTAVGGGVVR